MQIERYEIDVNLMVNKPSQRPLETLLISAKSARLFRLPPAKGENCVGEKEMKPLASFRCVDGSLLYLPRLCAKKKTHSEAFLSLVSST